MSISCPSFSWFLVPHRFSRLWSVSCRHYLLCFREWYSVTSRVWPDSGWWCWYGSRVWSFLSPLCNLTSHIDCSHQNQSDHDKYDRMTLWYPPWMLLISCSYQIYNNVSNIQMSLLLFPVHMISFFLRIPLHQKSCSCPSILTEVGSHLNP